MPFFSRDGIQFHFEERCSGSGISRTPESPQSSPAESLAPARSHRKGEGGRGADSGSSRRDGAALPFVFQHGLGGDNSQPFGLFAPPPGVRLLAFDCRAHGQTRPLGDPEQIGLAVFAEDLVAFLDHLGIERAVVGGISMGAAVSLNFGLRFPQRTLGLVLSRPAWLAGPRESNVGLFGKVAQFIRRHGATRGTELFQQTIEFANLRREFPDTARSLLGQFQEPRAEDAVARLERIPRDRPCRDLQELKSIRVPTLVLANRDDPVHPFEYGEALAATIPGAELREITAKSVSAERHAADVQRFVGEFLARIPFHRRDAETQRLNRRANQ